MDNVIRARAAETGVSFKDMADEYMKKVSLRRMVSPDDIASSVGYLLSEFGKIFQANRWQLTEMKSKTL